MSESTLRIGVLYPEVLGTYGDTGNAVVLCERARRRRIDADIISVDLDTCVPEDLDLYTLGGGEDTAQALAARKMSDGTGLKRAVERGAPILAICASLQVLGQWYEDANAVRVPGLGFLDVTTAPQGSRTIGEILTTPRIDGLTDLLTGFENHGGATTCGPDATPLGTVIRGTGNGVNTGDGACDGVHQGSIIATYMHGPVLARNPQLADYLLSQAMGIAMTDLSELTVPGVQRLREERLQAVHSEVGN